MAIRIIVGSQEIEYLSELKSAIVFCKKNYFVGIRYKKYTRVLLCKSMYFEMESAYEISNRILQVHNARVVSEVKRRSTNTFAFVAHELHSILSSWRLRNVVLLLQQGLTNL